MLISSHLPYVKTILFIHFSHNDNVIQGNYLLAVAEDSELSPRFLILPSPSPSLSLMIKSIAVQELMMPQEVPLPEDQPSDQATSAVEHSLDTVSCMFQLLQICLTVFGI